MVNLLHNLIVKTTTASRDEKLFCCINIYNIVVILTTMNEHSEEPT